MIHQLFDNFGFYNGSFVDHADGSATFLDPMGTPAFHIHVSGDHGVITNPFGVVMDSFHHTTAGVQHFDGMGTPTLTEQLANGNVNFIDSMNRRVASFDPMTHTVSTALGSLRFRLT
jgi:hypothetical protein